MYNSFCLNIEGAKGYLRPSIKSLGGDRPPATPGSSSKPKITTNIYITKIVVCLSICPLLGNAH